MGDTIHILHTLKQADGLWRNTPTARTETFSVSVLLSKRFCSKWFHIRWFELRSISSSSSVEGRQLKLSKRESETTGFRTSPIGTITSEEIPKFFHAFLLTTEIGQLSITSWPHRGEISWYSTELDIGVSWTSPHPFPNEPEYQDQILPTKDGLYQDHFKALAKRTGKKSTRVDLGWVAKRWKACFDLRANLISTKVSVRSTQVHARPGQTESQVDPGFQLASTCNSVWRGLYAKRAQLKSACFSNYATF